MEIKDIKITDIYSDTKFNCRGEITPLDVANLARDIEQHGLLQPIVIQPYKHENFKWRIIMGHRRFMAHKVLERETIPCSINSEATEQQALVLNLIENISRQELNILQEAGALAKLKNSGMGVIEVSEQLGKSTTWVDIRFKLLALPKEIQDAAAEGYIKQVHIRSLYNMSSVAEMLDAARKIKKAVASGQKPPTITSKNPKRNILKAKVRDTTDIFWMQEHIQDSVGNNFGTRCLAWAAGEISDFEIFKDIKKLAEEKSIPYSIPVQLQDI